MKKRRTRRRVRREKLCRVELLLLGVVLFAAGMLAVTLTGYARSRKAYRAAQALALSTPASTVTIAVTPRPDATPSQPPLETPPITVDFNAVCAEGKHVRAWLYSPDTIVNYPVTYYSNNEYYLTHDYTGTRSNAGALFFDTRVSKQLAGDNLIIYGHHMKDRSMFGSLLQYQKQTYYDKHPTLYLLTKEQNYRIDLFSARFVESDPRYYPIWFPDEQEKKTFLVTAISQSDFTPIDTDYRPDSRIVSLVTCAYSNYIEDAKYQVLGWLTPIG